MMKNEEMRVRTNEHKNIEDDELKYKDHHDADVMTYPTYC